MPPWGHFGGVWPIEKHSKVQYFGGWVKARAVQKNWWIHLHDMFMRKELPFGVVMIAPMLKFLVAFDF